MQSAFHFDTSQIEWTHFQGSPRFDYPIDYAVAVLAAQPELGALDLLVKWAPNAYCHFHRHLAATTTLVLAGEQHIRETGPDGEAVHIVRTAGDYARSPGGDVHMERAGPDGLMVFFGMQSADGRLFETLDKDHNVLATATIENWAAGRIKELPYRGFGGVPVVSALISADSHVVEPGEVFTGLAEKFGDEAPRVMDTEDQVDAIVIPKRGLRGTGAARLGLAGLRLREGAKLVRRPGRKPEVDDLTDPAIMEILNQGYGGLRQGIRSGAARPDDQDADGLSLELLYPGYFGMFSLPNVDLLVACQKNYNDWVFDYASDANGRLEGLAAIPLQDPDAGLTELRRVIDKGFKGVCIPCTSPAEKPYFEACYDPIWALAQEAGMPVSMHVGCNAHVPSRLRPPTPDPLAAYAGSAAAIQRTLVELLCRGAADRFPNLKIVVAEFNAGWLAHWLARLDQGVARENRFGRGPFMALRPLEIWHRQFYATIEDGRAAILTREILGVDNLMWGADYPHSDSTWPCSREVLSELMAEVPAAEVQKITHDNVAAHYGL